MKHVLVTGGAGFIGSNLIHSLLQDKGVYISCIDNYDQFYSKKIKARNIQSLNRYKNFSFIEGDIRNTSDLLKVKNVSSIIHLAAKTGVRSSIDNAELFYDVNVNGTQNLLEYAQREGIRQFVFGSSSSVYGINDRIPWKEDESLIPISPYASSKISAEKLGAEYSSKYGIRFISLRFFTVYGPGQRPDLAIYKFLSCILNQQPIPMYGNGSSKREYTFIDDIVTGITSALDYQHSSFEAINLGSFKTTDLKTLIECLEEICNRKAVIHYLPEQPGDVPLTHSDLSKAMITLNYKPTIELNEGLRLFYKWYKKNVMTSF